MSNDSQEDQPVGVEKPIYADTFFTTERRLEFVRYIEQHQTTDGLTKAIDDFGAGSEQLYLVWKGLIDHTEKEVRDNLSGDGSRRKRLRPGVGYMAIGVVAMVLGALIYKQLPAPFVFVTMVLGIAVFLYGTGTQAVGDVTRNTSGAETIRANVRIAGGAGVMALVVGAGLIFGSQQMQTTFVERTQYSKAIISIAGGVRGDTVLFVQDSFQDRHLARYHDGKIEVIFEHEIGERPASGCYTFQLQGVEKRYPIEVNVKFDEQDEIRECQQDASIVNPTLARGIYRMTIERRDTQGRDDGQRFAEGGTPINIGDIGSDVADVLQ